MLHNGKATDALSVRPTCSFCFEAAAVDGGTRRGWAYMCVFHFRRYGSGLGEGVGQVLLCGDDRDAALKEELL